MNSTCLATVVHKEPLWTVAYKLIPKLAGFYTHKVVECTDKTTKDVKLFLSESGFDIKQMSGDSLGTVRRRVLARALNTGADIVHFADFDRLLFWVMNYPDELWHCISSLDPERLTVFGRTKAAMDSHPTIQLETERLGNRLFAQVFRQEIDILAASRGIPQEIGKEILHLSTQDNPACIDAEWPLLAGRDRIKEVRVNGLGYESNLLDIEKNYLDEIRIRIEHLRALSEYLFR